MLTYIFIMASLPRVDGDKSIYVWVKNCEHMPIYAENVVGVLLSTWADLVVYGDVLGPVLPNTKYVRLPQDYLVKKKRD